MKSQPKTNPVPEAPADFVTIAALLAPGGLIARTLNPAPSRSSLARSFHAMKIPRWKCRGGQQKGGGEVYYHRQAVEIWMAHCTWTGKEVEA